MSVSLHRLYGFTEAQITAAISDRISRAFLLTNADHQMMALDFNARLVTELRLSGVWPARYREPQP